MSAAVRIVMMIDQVQSTPQAAVLTPAEIQQVVRAQAEMTAAVVKECQGRIAGNRGDGVLVEFQSSSQAVRCGAVLQQRVRARNLAQVNERVRFDLHIGIEAGEVELAGDGELQGFAANIAARVGSECPPGEVYFTEKVKEEVHVREAEVEQVGIFSLRGVPGKVTLYRMARWLGDRVAVRNPFVWRAGITQAEAFWGRRREQHMIQDFLHKRQNCQIVGQRRIGKTSLLRQVERAAPDWDADVAVAYLDLQAPQCFSLTGWLRLVSRRLQWNPAVTGLPEFAESIEAMLNEGRRPLLCLDEFGELGQRPQEFKRDFFLTLRSCGQQGMSIITASQRPLHELSSPENDDFTPFYNTFSLIRLGPFPESVAREYVRLHRPGVPSFSPEDQDLILEVSRGHPLALQLTCFHVLEAKENGESLTSALRRAEEEMKAHLPAWGSEPGLIVASC